MQCYALIIPPHIEYKHLNLCGIQIPNKFPLSLLPHLALAFGEKKSHAPVESPLSGDGPAEHDDIPGKEATSC